MERGDKSRIWKKNLNSGKKVAFYALWKVRSGDAMKTQIAPLKKMIKLLNQLGDTTEDSYLLYDPKTDRFYFSSNILSIFDKFQDDTFSCSSEVWRSVVYPLDLEKVDTINQELVHHIRTSYNFNYRMEDPQGRIIWINSRGKSYFDEQEQSQYILGRISREVVFDIQNEGYRPTITKELSRLYAAGQEGYLLIVGIDNLRRINLRQGREFGDALIGFLAEHIQIAAAGKAVFRINGDCFCVLLNHTDRIQVDAFFQRIQKDLKEQCSLSGGAVPLQTYKVSDGSILLEYAESALETAKLSGKSRLCFFHPPIMSANWTNWNFWMNLRRQFRMTLQVFLSVTRDKYVRNVLNFTEQKHCSDSNPNGGAWCLLKSLFPFWRKATLFILWDCG